MDKIAIVGTAAGVVTAAAGYFMSSLL